jgi:hypothetical protein
VAVGDRVRIFLGGSIDMGKAPDWQNAFANKVLDHNWKQDFKDENLRHQIDWEMTNIDKVDLINIYLHPGTISPVSLLELGLYAQSGKHFVCCREDIIGVGMFRPYARHTMFYCLTILMSSLKQPSRSLSTHVVVFELKCGVELVAIKQDSRSLISLTWVNM